MHTETTNSIVTYQLEELVADNKIQAKEITQIKELLRSLIARPVIILIIISNLAATS